jgi:TetR/AcrR family transcriptional regulator, cholesterol catabolism regulator
MNGTMRTFSEDGELVKARRNHIAKCAVSVFSKKGYERVTLREICKICDMAPGTLYHYVGGKRDILYLVIKYLMEQAADFVTTISAETKNMDAVDGLRLAIKKYFEFIATHEEDILFLYRDTINLEPQFRKSIYALEKKNIQAYRTIISKGIKTGKFRVVDDVILAHNILVAGQMWAFRRWSLREHCTFEQYVAAQTNAMLSAIST